MTASRVVIPLLGVGVLLLYRNHPIWALVLAGAEVILAVAGGTRRASSRLRAWALPIALFLASTAALLLAGRWDVAAVLSLAGIAVLTMTVGRRAGSIALGSIVILQVGYGLLTLSRRSPPAGDGQGLSFSDVTSTAAVTLLAGWSVIAALAHLTAGWAATLAGARKETEEAEARSTQLVARGDALLATHRTIQQRTTYLEASLAATQKLSTQLGLSELLDRAAVAAASHFGFDEAQVYLLDSMGEWATLVSTSRADDGAAITRGYRLHTDGDTLVGWVMSHRQVRITHADGGASERGGAPDGAGGDPGTEMAIALPLEAGGQMLGVLVLLTGHAVVVNKEDLGVLKAFADYLAYLIDHARGLRDEAAVSEIGAPFLGTANLLATARTESDVYDVILDVLRDAGPGRVLIVRTMDGGEALRVVLDYRGRQAERVRVDLVDLSPPSLVDLALVGLALESPLWAEDLTNLDPSLSPELGQALHELADTGRSAGLALIPLRAGVSRAEGEIIVLYTKAHRFTVVERRLHQLLVDFGGAALERTRLLAEVQGRSDLAQQRSVIETRIERAPDVEMILKVAVREMARALRAADGEIRLHPGAVDAATDREAHHFSPDEATSRPGV